MTHLPMFSSLARRLLRAVQTLAGVLLLNFLLVHMAPGDPASVLASESGGASPEYVQALREKYGLDQALPVQLAAYVRNVLTLDLGFSPRNNAKVTDLIADRMGPTLLLMGSALVLSIVIGVALGLVSAVRLNSRWDRLISVASVLAYATPLFWIGLMLILVFSVWLNWFPSAGMEDVTAFYEGSARALDIAHHLVLPCITLALFYTAVYSRLTRATMVDQTRQDYVTTARAKGLGEQRVTWRHILPNAVLPVITMAGVQAGALLGGSVVVETVFAWPGLGTLAYQALFARDLNLLLGIFLLSAVLVVLINIVVDLVYRWVDPRIAVH